MAPFHIAEVAQSKEKLPSQVGRDRVGRSLRFEIAKADDLRLLRARRERPSCRAAQKRDELAALHAHSITSSARASRLSGKVSPSALAVLRLITVSYFTGACTGRSPGFSPLRMRST